MTHLAFLIFSRGVLFVAIIGMALSVLTNLLRVVTALINGAAAADAALKHRSALWHGVQY